LERSTRENKTHIKIVYKIKCYHSCKTYNAIDSIYQETYDKTSRGDLSRKQIQEHEADSHKGITAILETNISTRNYHKYWKTIS